MSNSKYGVKIKNIEISSLYDYKNGVRDYFLSKNAMFTNSLFLDYLLENGLKITKSGFTQDIICFEYNMNCKSYKEQIKIINNAIDKNKQSDKYDENKDKKLNDYLEKIKSISNKFKKMSKDDIRIDSYSKPISITYKTKMKDNTYKILDTVKSGLLLLFKLYTVLYRDLETDRKSVG